MPLVESVQFLLQYLLCLNYQFLEKLGIFPCPFIFITPFFNVIFPPLIGMFIYFVFVKLIASSSNSTTDLNLTFLTSDSLNAWHPILFNVFGNSIFLIPLTNLNASSQTDFTPSFDNYFLYFPLYFPASNVHFPAFFPYHI